MAENKKVTLHPLKTDGSIDENINLFPKTNNIVNENGELIEVQEKLIAGDNIIITGNTISATGGGGSSSVTIKEINEADITPELLQEVYNEVPEILRINSTGEGIQDYELKVNDKNNNYISYTCIIGGIEIELRLENSNGTVIFSTNVLYFMPSNLINNLYTSQQVDSLLNNKQNTLVSGTNIKTINNESILGEGNIDIQGGGGITVPTFDAHFEGEPEFEDFQLTQEDLNDIWENKYPLIKIRVTIEEEGQTIYYIICFKLSYNVDGMAMTYAMTSMEFSNDAGHQYDLDCMSFIIALNEETNLPMIAAVNEEYYTNDYRKLENKPNIPEIVTTIGPESLDDTVPSSKCVYDYVNAKSGGNGTITIGSTTLTEAQLQALLALITIKHSITYNLPQDVTSTNDLTEIEDGEYYTTTLRGSKHFTIDVTMGGTSIIHAVSDFDGGSGEYYDLTITSVTGDLVITVTM